MRNYLYQTIKDNFDFNIEVNSILVGNVDKTPIYLEPIITTILANLGEKAVKTFQNRNKEYLA